MELLRSTVKTSWTKTSPTFGGVAQWLLELLRRGSRERHPATKQLHLLETLSLGGKRQLLLVSCGGEHFLVGGGLESVETIVRVQTEDSRGETAKKLDGLCL
jgi:hypothetical protein